MEIQALASGSSGNAFLLRADEGALLLECGLSPARTESLLRARDILPGQLLGVLLTHEHGDHSRGALQTARRFEAPLISSCGTLRALGVRSDNDHHELRPERVFEIGAFQIWPFAVPHDAIEPFGFRISANGATVGFATDFGCVADAVVETLRKVDLLVIESNHDEDMLWAGRYPWSLKQRVASDVGHLSNDAAAHLLVSLGVDLPPEVWLAHLSKHNNSPQRALGTVADQLVKYSNDAVRLLAASGDRPSLSWTPDNNTRQLELFAEPTAATVTRAGDPQNALV